MSSEIIIVSGLPRSGTSLMMQMLHAGGVHVLTDGERAADTDNPRGYFEFERVKQTKRDQSWLPVARGLAVKMISQLLYDLPATEQYRVLFLERDMDEVLRSQEKMLQRLGKPVPQREQISRAFTAHLEKLHAWLAEQRHMPVLRVPYAALVERPEEEARRIAAFLGRELSIAKMAAAVDPALYRNRSTQSAPASG
jgi:hypothetical protein